MTTKQHEAVTETETKAKAETKITTVTMADNRVVEFAGKRKLLKESFVDEHGKISVRLDFINGETRTFHLPHDLLAKFAAHGAEQKLGDEVVREDTVEDMVQALDELMVRLSKGEWNAKREGGSGAGGSILARALVELTKKTPQAISEFLAGLDAKTKLALRKDAALSPIIARLEAEKAARASEKAPAVDTASLLAGLAG
jgi:hypothetical protein